MLELLPSNRDINVRLLIDTYVHEFKDLPRNTYLHTVSLAVLISSNYSSDTPKDVEHLQSS
jgi:hypothetical protein